MGLKQVRGAKRPANYAINRQDTARDPLLTIYESGKAQMSARCKDLFSTTAITDPEIVKQVSAFAERVKNPDSWTKEEVAELSEQVGRIPFPKTVDVEHLTGQHSLLLRVATTLGPSVTELIYSKGSNRPTFNILPVLKDEGVKVPKGMCLEVPVTLVMDSGVLKVEARLNHGKERVVRKDDEEENGLEEDDE